MNFKIAILLKYIIKDDFGLSISSYPNQSNGKPPIYTPPGGSSPAAPRNPYEEFNERQIKTNGFALTYFQQSPSEYSMYPDEYSASSNNVTTLPLINDLTSGSTNGGGGANKPKFEPTKATQYDLKL